MELENTVRVFLISLVLEKLGRLSRVKCLVTTASARSFLKEVTKGGFMEDQKDLGILDTSLFVFFLHTNAEDHRNPQGTRLPASREVRTLAKVFRQRVVDLLISEYAEGC